MWSPMLHSFGGRALPGKGCYKYIPELSGDASTTSYYFAPILYSYSLHYRMNLTL